MNRYFSQMLLGNLPKVQRQGRAICFSGTEIDIHLITGSMRERVLTYLDLTKAPATAKEISEGIGSESGRVNRVLQQLVAAEQISAIKLEGTVKEYVLAKPLAPKVS